MLLVLLLVLALIPAAGTLASMAQQDLAASLDDFYRAKAQAAAYAGLALVEVDLLQGGEGQIGWDWDGELTILIDPVPQGWHVEIIASSQGAEGMASTTIINE